MRWRCLGLIVGLLALTSAGAQATPVTVDEIVYATEGDTDPGKLSGDVDMSLSGDKLSIELTNTSDAGASNEPASRLLTGIGFNLDGASINGGSATVGGKSSRIKFTGGDLSKEWGFETNPDNGPFQESPDGDLAGGSVDAVVATLQASVETKFANGSSGGNGNNGQGKGSNKNQGQGGDNVNGPSFGLLSDNVDDDKAGGQEAVKDTLEIDLTLSGGNIPSVSDINTGHVALSFGSPNASRTSVPLPATVALLGAGLVTLGILTRRRPST